MDLNDYNIKSGDLARLRLLLTSQSPPKLETGPVTDIGSGISHGVANIITSLNHQREQQRLQALLKDQADAEALKTKNTDALLKNLTGIEGLAGTDSSIINNLINQHKAETEQQGLKDALLNLRDSSGLPFFNEAAVEALSRDKEAASSVLKTFGGQEIGSTRALGAEELLGSLKDRQPTPLEQAYLKSIGVDYQTYFQRLKEGADLKSAISDSVIKGQQANFAPQIEAGKVTQQNQQITTNNQSIQLNENKLTRDNALLQQQNDFLNSPGDPTAAKRLGLFSAALSDNPYSSLNTLLPDKAALFNSPADLTIPNPTAAQPNNGFGLNLPTLSVSPGLSPNVDLTPQARANVLRKDLGAGIKSGVSGLSNLLNDWGRNTEYGIRTGLEFLGVPTHGIRR